MSEYEFTVTLEDKRRWSREHEEEIRREVEAILENHFEEVMVVVHSSSECYSSYVD